MRSATWVAVASIVILGAFSAAISVTAGEKEEKTTIDKVPAAVKAAIEKATTGGTVKEIEKEQHDGKVVYEVDYVKDGEEKEIEVAEDGTIVKKEEKTTIDKVPAAVKAAIEKATTGGTVKEIEKEQYDGKVIYEVDYVKDGEEKAIQVTQDGTIVKKEEKTTIDKVPAVVKAVIEKATAGGKVKQIEKEQYDGKVVYDVDYVKDGEKKEINVAENGTIVTSAKKEDDDK